MKKYKVLSLIVATAGMFASCSEELTKAEVDAQNYPNATIELSDITLGEVGTTTADVTFDVIGYTPEILEIAVVYSTTPDFANTHSTVFTDSVDGETIAMTIKGLDMETTYYATAYAYMRGAAVTSDTITFTTKAEPISKEMLNGKAYGKAQVADYWGDKHDFSFSLVMGEGNQVFVHNLDPFFAANGFTADRGVNILEGVLEIAEDGKTATITCATNQLVGYDDCIFICTETGAENLPYVINITKNGAKLSIPTLFGVSSAAGWYTLFPPTEFDAL